MYKLGLNAQWKQVIAYGNCDEHKKLSYLTFVLIKIILCLNSRRHSCTWVFCPGSVQHGHGIQQQGVNIWKWGSGCLGQMSQLQRSRCPEEQCWSPCSIVIGKVTLFSVSFLSSIDLLFADMLIEYI